MRGSFTGIVVLTVVFGFLSGCASKQSFSTSGRPGETVSLNVGWHPDLKRENLTVSIQPCLGDLLANAPAITTNARCAQNSGTPIVYTLSSPELRAVVNMYPDPVSRLVYDKEAKSALSLGDTIEGFATNQDKEYLQTMVLLDIPTSIPMDSSVASVSLSDTSGAALSPLYVEVHHLPYLSQGFPNWNNTTISNNQFRAFERQAYKTVTFSGTTVPYAIQVDLSHNVGTFYVVNPRADVKNLSWSDSGGNLRVMLTPAWNKGVAPANGETLSKFVHFKFYIAGDVDVGGLTIPVGGVQGFDINGNPIANLTASVQ